MILHESEYSVVPQHKHVDVFKAELSRDGGSLWTDSLITCISVGGAFPESGSLFLTHKSELDYDEQVKEMTNFAKCGHLFEQIGSLFLFHSDFYIRDEVARLRVWLQESFPCSDIRELTYGHNDRWRYGVAGINLLNRIAFTDIQTIRF